MPGFWQMSQISYWQVKRSDNNVFSRENKERSRILMFIENVFYSPMTLKWNWLIIQRSCVCVSFFWSRCFSIKMSLLCRVLLMFYVWNELFHFNTYPVALVSRMVIFQCFPSDLRLQLHVILLPEPNSSASHTCQKTYF